MTADEEVTWALGIGTVLFVLMLLYVVYRSWPRKAVPVLYPLQPEQPNFYDVNTRRLRHGLRPLTARQYMLAAPYAPQNDIEGFMAHMMKVVNFNTESQPMKINVSHGVVRGGGGGMTRRDDGDDALIAGAVIGAALLGGNDGDSSTSSDSDSATGK